MKQKLYQLLMVEHRAMLEGCYRQVFFADGGTPPIKTFDDYLSDFYLYLLEAKPKHVKDGVEGYYLKQVRDEKALPEWLRQTFRHFLLDEYDILHEMQEALREYRQQLAAYRPDQPLDLTLMHVAFSMAWFNQHENEQDRYLFFRSAFKHFSGFYAWPDTELDDHEVATVLGLTYDNLRQRTSRLCDKVRRLVTTLTDASIATLNHDSLDVAHSIYADPDPDIEAILSNLLERAERDLPQHDALVALRQSKRQSAVVLQAIIECKHSYAMPENIEMSESLAMPEFDMAQPCMASFRSEPVNPEPRIVSLFKQFIGL